MVDVLFQSHTSDFPYVMVYEYVQKCQPFLINDLESEQLLWDRTVTYQALKEIDVPIPRYLPLYLHEDHLERLEKDCYGKILSCNGQVVPYEQYVNTTKESPQLFRSLYNRSQ